MFKHNLPFAEQQHFCSRLEVEISHFDTQSYVANCWDNIEAGTLGMCDWLFNRAIACVHRAANSTNNLAVIQETWAIEGTLKAFFPKLRYPRGSTFCRGSRIIDAIHKPMATLSRMLVAEQEGGLLFIVVHIENWVHCLWEESHRSLHTDNAMSPHSDYFNCECPG